MKKYLTIFLAGAVMAVASATLAAAPFNQDHGKGHGHGNDKGHYDDDHHNDHHGNNPHYEGMHDRGRHEGWYKKGGHLPREYRVDRYVVTDWHHDHLREPPHGYHWVRSDNGDFLLVAIATGVITDLILNH